MKSQLINMVNVIFGFLIVLFLTSFAAALPICPGAICGSVINSPASANPDSDVTIQFNVTYDGIEGSAPTTSLDFSQSTTNIGTWKTLPPSSTQINKGSALPLTAVLHVPKGATGTINAVIKFRAGTGSSNEIVIPQININSFSSITITPETQEIRDATGVNIKVDNTGNNNLNSIEITQSGPFAVTFSENTFSLSSGSSKNVIVTPVDLSKLNFGLNSVTLTARDSVAGVQDTAIVTHTKSFCKNGDIGGNLSINKVNINSDGSDDEEWTPLDRVEVEVKVEDIGNDKINDIQVHLGFFDSAGKNKANDLNFENVDDEKIDLGNLKDGEDDTVTFTFVVPADFDDGSYKLAIKAFSDNRNLGESKECTDFSDDFNNDVFQDIDVTRENDKGKFITFDNIEVRPTEQVTCGDSVTINMDVFNIGDEDQDQVRVNLVNSQLGLKLEREIRENVDQGDKKSISFTFIVPAGLADKLYPIELTADYDYSRGTYKQSSDDSTQFNLNVIGCSLPPSGGTSGKIALITASLDSDAKAGEELVVRSTVTGLIPGQANYAVSASGFESWATLNSISERTLPLAEGQSREVVLSFSVKEDVKGDQSFTLETRSGDKLERREVAVTIEETTSTGGFSFGDNSLVWIIGIINVILIVLIIVVAARISKR